MKNADIKKLSAQELSERLATCKSEYAKLKLAHGISPIDNPIQLRKLRREIARLNTVLRNQP